MFPAANTALPFANQDQHQMDLEQNFLKSGVVSIDIFAMSTAAPKESAGATPHPELQTTFAVGEEAEMPTTGEAIGSAAPVTAPLNEVNAAVRRGDSVRVDVVVRTRKVGHFFPGGTVDAFDTWVELKGVDDKGRTIFWSGGVADDGKGRLSSRGARLSLAACRRRRNRRRPPPPPPPPPARPPAAAAAAAAAAHKNKTEGRRKR